jgi:MIP family channel proteins
MSVSLTRRLAAEAIGTGLLVILGPGAAAVSAARGGSITLEGVAACNGLAILVLIYALGHISGAHFNPGVTLSFAVFRHFQVRDVVPYWLAQLGGALIGAGILHALFGHFADAAVTSPSGSDLQSFGLEVVLTFVLMLVITSVATDTRAAGQAAAIAIGAAVGLDVLLGGSISGGSMNPARSFGPAVASGDLGSLWIYLIAPPLGALGGALFYTFIRDDNV